MLEASRRIATRCFRFDADITPCYLFTATCHSAAACAMLHADILRLLACHLIRTFSYRRLFRQMLPCRHMLRRCYDAATISTRLDFATLPLPRHRYATRC